MQFRQGLTQDNAVQNYWGCSRDLEGLALAQVTAVFHAGGSLRFVCHRALAQAAQAQFVLQITNYKGLYGNTMGLC